MALILQADVTTVVYIQAMAIVTMAEVSLSLIYVIWEPIAVIAVPAGMLTETAMTPVKIAWMTTCM